MAGIDGLAADATDAGSTRNGARGTNIWGHTRLLGHWRFFFLEAPPFAQQGGFSFCNRMSRHFVLFFCGRAENKDEIRVVLPVRHWSGEK